MVIDSIWKMRGKELFIKDFQVSGKSNYWVNSGAIYWNKLGIG